MSFDVKNNVHWVGKIDWELERFHGYEYSTNRGSSYNSFLIKEEKVALIDTVWGPYANEFVENLAKEIDLDKIDYVIANHAEPDHSGALPRLMRHIPDTPIYCTQNGVKSLKGQYHQDWNFNVVKTGDTLNLGDKDLVFVEMPMLHWPDSMLCYLTGDNLLFSNDAFGHHYASELMFADLVDQAELYAECIKYYANILTPFSALAVKKIKEILALNLPLDMICPSHGVIWRKRPEQIVDKYLEWADSYQENQITIIYDTMWNSTRKMAECIAKGICDVDKEVNIKLFHLEKKDKNDVITEIFKSKAVIVGSPTVNRGILTSVAAILELIKGLKFKGKKAAAFGSYGWSGESAKIIYDSLETSGFELMDDALKVSWKPDNESELKCFEYGKMLSKKLA
nr:anaerobic nitric oxide reductase flavorubredoxin [uncultured Desulfobacter sp.]